MTKTQTTKTITSEHGKIKAVLWRPDRHSQIYHDGFVRIWEEQITTESIHLDNLPDLIACLQEIQEAVNKGGEKK